MKPRSFRLAPAHVAAIILLLAGCTLAFISWGRQEKQTPHFYQHSPNDTTPEKKKAPREKQVRDLDEALESLNNLDLKTTIDDAMKQAMESIKQVDMAKIQEEVSEAMKSIDMDKIRDDVNKAVKEVDMAKIQQEINKSMASVNWDKLNDDLKKVKDIDMSKMQVDMSKIKDQVADAMKQVDMAKIQQQIDASMSKIDWDKIKNQIDEVKKIDMSKLEGDMKNMRKEMDRLGPQLEKEMKKANEQIEKAKAELKDYKTLVDGLDADGLLNKKEPYTIVHKDGKLTVNGKEVPASIYNKYRSVLEKHKSLNINRDEDDFNINNNDKEQ